MMAASRKRNKVNKGRKRHWAVDSYRPDNSSTAHINTRPHSPGINLLGNRTHWQKKLHFSAQSRFLYSQPPLSYTRSDHDPGTNIHTTTAMSFYAKLRDKTTSYTTPLVHLAAWNPLHSRWDRFEYPGLQLRIEDSSLAIEVVASIDVSSQNLRPNQPSIVSDVVATQLWLPRDPKQPIGYYLHDSGFAGQQHTESEGSYVVYYARLDNAGSVFTVSEGLKGSPCQMAGEKFRHLHDGLERMASHKILGRAQDLWIKLGVAQNNAPLAGDIFRQFGGFGLLHKNLLPSGPDSPFVGIFERGSDNVPFERYHNLPQVSLSIAKPTSVTDGSPASLKR